MKLRYLFFVFALFSLNNVFCQSWLSGWNTFGTSDAGYAIKTDQSGNIYATGYIHYSSGAFDTITSGGFLARFSQSGNLLWARHAGFNPSGLAIDKSGNVFVNGSFGYNNFIGDTLLPLYGGVNQDLFTSKFDSSGNLLWARSAGGNYLDIANSIACDATGNSYITGNFADTAFFSNDTLISHGASDIFVASYDSSGNYRWSVDAGGQQDYEAGNGIACDSSGHIYVTGTFKDTAWFGNIRKISSGLSDIFLAKYDTAGNILWVQSDGVSFNLDVGRGVACDHFGDPYICAGYNNAAYVAKYNSSGVQQWIQTAQSGVLERATGIAVSDSGKVYITGTFEQSISFPGGITAFSAGDADIFTACFSNTGNVEWLLSGGGPGDDESSGICNRDDGNIYSTGMFTGNASFGSLTLYALDSIYQSAYFINSVDLINSISENIFDDSLIIYPDPSDNNINIKLNPDFISNISIYNCAGMKIYFGTSYNRPVFSSGITELPSGIYYIIVETASHFQRASFIKN